MPNPSLGKTSGRIPGRGSIAWTLLVLLACSAGGCARRVPPAASYDPRIYVADWANHRVLRMDDMEGGNWTTLGGPGDPRGRLRFPVGLYVDTNGLVYLAEQHHDRILRLDPRSSSPWTIFSLSTRKGRPVNRYAGSWICLDRTGRIYFTYDGEHRILRMDDMNGTNLTTFGAEGSGGGQFRYPAGIQVDDAGRIYVADFDNFRIVRLEGMEGTGWTAFGRYGSGQGEFINPCGLALDRLGRIYVADQGNDRIVRMDDMAGTNWTSIGSFGTDRRPGRFYAPCGVCVDALGRIYVSECSSNHRIVRMDDMTGANWMVLGQGGSGLGEFASPMGIFVR